MVKSKRSRSRNNDVQNVNSTEKDQKKNKKGCVRKKNKTYPARNIDFSNNGNSINDNSTKSYSGGIDQTDFGKPIMLKDSNYLDTNNNNNNSRFIASNDNLLITNDNNNVSNRNERNLNNDELNRNNQDNSNMFQRTVTTHEINERIDRTVIDRNPKQKLSGNYYSSKSESHINSRSPTESFRQTKNPNVNQVYDLADFNQSFGQKLNSKGYRNDNKINNNYNINNNNSVTVERSIVNSQQRSINSKNKGMIPVLKTNKTYDISFTLGNLPSQSINKKLNKKEMETIEYSVRNMDKNEIRQSGDKKQTDNKVMQTDDSLTKFNSKSSIVQFEDLMKDVNLNGIQQNRYNAVVTDRTDGRLENNQNSNSNNNTNMLTNYTGTKYEERTMYGSNGGIVNDGTNQNRNRNTIDTVYSDHKMNGRVAASEVDEIKEWMIVEYPDGHQEKREYRKEKTEDGDVNYIDIINGNMLKRETAAWKTGEEYMKTDRGTKKVKYEWRKDNNTNGWVKYDASTNEVLKRGDWKSGSEWFRNSKGKLEERPYKYIQNENSEWVKVDPSSGKIIDFSFCTALNGYDWVPNGNQSRKKLNDRRWRKREYKYVQNDKGKWDKIDQETQKKIGKSTKNGWKEGFDYHMNKDGKVSKVHYIWDTKQNGIMEKVNKKNKEPVNSSWQEGREIIMRGDVVNNNNFAWVNIGRNKWVKIDRDTGAPISGVVKSNKLSAETLPSQLTKKALVTKTTKRIDNNKVVEENTKIEQNEGGVLKSTTKTTQFVKK